MGLRAKSMRPQYDLPDLPQLNRTPKAFNEAGGAYRVKIIRI